MVHAVPVSQDGMPSSASHAHGEGKVKEEGDDREFLTSHRSHGEPSVCTTPGENCEGLEINISRSNGLIFTEHLRSCDIMLQIPITGWVHYTPRKN